MSSLALLGSALGSSLADLLTTGEIVPGSAPGYQTCKTIYAYHPLGRKLVDVPIERAQSQAREISVPRSPEARVKEAFEAEWRRLGVDKIIANCGRLARMYGISSTALLTEGEELSAEVDWERLWDRPISFNVLDPLNTAGSLVLNQDPNAPDFQKCGAIVVNGKTYNRSRTVTLLNEEPLYIEYTTSAFGFVGRSVFQRILYPLKSYIQTMVADDMVSLKAGVIIEKAKSASSLTNALMQAIAGVKRAIVKIAQTLNVITIDVGEEIETLNLENVNKAMETSRRDILENIAAGAPMPATMMNSETFAQGFADGTEDAKREAEYVATIRVWLQPLYEFFDRVVQYRAWNPEFYKTIQAEFAEDYGEVPFRTAFYRWRNSYRAQWPNLLQEPDSQKVIVDDVKLKALIAWADVFLPTLDPENKAAGVKFVADNMNDLKLLFPNPLVIDYEALREYTPPQPMTQPGEPTPAPPFSARDSLRPSMVALDDAVARLTTRQGVRRLSGAAGDERREAA